MSGTIGAVGDNGVGVIGVCPNVKIMPLKFLDSDGYGYTSDAIRAIEYARMMNQRGVNIRLTNNSWGGGGYSVDLYNSIAAMADRGMLFVAAAGNSGANTDTSAQYPADYTLDNIISVAATDCKDKLASFSNYGKQTVDIAAPGVNILSTLPNGNYGRYSGTSMATPHVTGALALLQAAEPSLTWAEMRQRLLDTADWDPEVSGKVQCDGRLNAHGLLDPLWKRPPADFMLTAVEFADPAGNGDGVASPGETIQLTPTIYNTGLYPAANVHVSAVSNSPDAVILTAAQSLGTIASHSGQQLSTPFVVQIAPGAFHLEQITIDFNIEWDVAQQKSASYSLQVLRLPQPDSIQGAIFDDLDNDGKWDANEPRLAGHTVYLDNNRNGQLDPGEPSAPTDSAGEYRFESLASGQYVVELAGATGWEQTFPTRSYEVAGNIFAVNAAKQIIECTAAGALVQTLTPPTSYGTPADLVVDSNGRLQVLFHGDQTVLGTYDMLARTWTSHAVSGWDGNDYGIAAYDRYVYVLDYGDHGAVDRGIIRFDINTYQWERFGKEAYASYGDLSIGLNGLLYALYSNHAVFVYDPVSLACVRQFQLNGVSAKSLAVNRAGEIYVCDNTTHKIFQCRADGKALRSIDIGLTSATYGLDLSADGTLIAASYASSGAVIVFDESFQAFTRLPIGGSVVSVAFAQRSRPGSQPVLASDSRGAGDINFGVHLVAEADVRGSVWLDRNGDGSQTAGETGLAGQVVYLDLDGDGEQDADEPARTSDVLGDYSFLDLAPGAYDVRLARKLGWRQTSDPLCYTLHLAVGDVATGIDFGVAEVDECRLKGIKFDDLNGNGVRDAGEAGLPGWTIYVDANNNGRFDPGELSTLTGADGSYEFAGLPQGVYTVGEVNQAGWRQTGPRGGLPLSGNLIFAGAAGYFDEYNLAAQQLRHVIVPYPEHLGESRGTESVRDVVVDAAGRIDVYNGTFAPYLSMYDSVTDSWTHLMCLGLTQSNYFLTGGIAAIGDYVFLSDASTNGGVESGVVRFDLTTGLSQRFDDGCTISAVSMGLDGRLYVLLQQPGYSFSNFLHIYDPFTLQRVATLALSTSARDVVADQHGEVYGIDEDGAYLYHYDRNGLVTQALSLGSAARAQSIALAADGQILIAGGLSSALAGKIILSDVSLQTYQLLTQTTGGGKAAWATRSPAHSYTVSLDRGGQAQDLDFGGRNITWGDIRGVLWEDADADGIRDSGEEPLEDRTVFLDANANGQCDPGEQSTSTNAVGMYVFDAVPPGDYVLTVTDRPGWEIAAPGGISPWTLHVRPGDRLANIDLGLHKVPEGSIRGVIFRDINGNGAQDAGERSLPGVDVYLDEDNDGLLDTGEPVAVTDSNGQYEFASLADGIHLVRAVLPASWAISHPGNGYPLPGNILVSAQTSYQTCSLLECTSNGSQVSSLQIPYPGSSRESGGVARGITSDSFGQVYVFNGGYSPYLSVYDLSSQTWLHRTISDWRTDSSNNTGGIDVYGHYVFVTSCMPYGTRSGGGILRFDTRDQTVTCCAGDTSFRDVTIGLDGLMYGVWCDSQSVSSSGIYVFDPETLACLRTFSFSFGASDVAVDRNGDMFVAGSNGEIYQVSPAGVVLRQQSVNIPNLSSIDLAVDGTLIVGNRFGFLAVGSTALDNFTWRQIIQTDYDETIHVAFARRATDGSQATFLQPGETVEDVDFAVFGNDAPQATVALNTAAPRSDESLQATATKSDADGDAVTLTFVWRVNGVVARTFTSATALTDTFDLSVAGNGDPGDVVTVEVTPSDGFVTGTPATDTATVTTSVIAGRHVFYNNSYYDGNNTAANAQDDSAIATDKTALLPGQKAGFANYTSYNRGINGVMVDIAGVAGPITAADFEFKVGN
ncbi:MAG: SdrD B-like domain-containing protein, partial [Thermoguttaceae bacterium]